MQLFKRLVFSIAFSFGALSLNASAEQVSLYDASQGNVPGQQGNLILGKNGISRALVARGVDLDSTAVDGGRGGYTKTVSVDLERDMGINLDFALQVQSESHLGNADRAGFSTIPLANDLFGIELGFGKARSLRKRRVSRAPRMFSFDTTNALTDYSLQIIGTQYSLLANGQAILGGLLRDYSSSGGIFIYQQPNVLLIGDDTQSAQAHVTLGDVTLTTSVVPIPPSILLMVSACLALASRRRIRT